MEAKPKTKLAAIVDQINGLLPPQVLNEFELRRLKREAESLINTDAYSSYIAQGMIACLEADIVSLNNFHSKALKLVDDASSRQDYGSSLNNVGMYSDALAHFETAYLTCKDDISLLKHFLDSALSSFQFHLANEVLRNVLLMQPGSEEEHSVVVDAYTLMKKYDISDDDTLPVRNAYSKVLEKGYRVWGVNITLCEEDGFEWLDMEFKVSAPLDVVVDMNFQFAELIVNDSDDKVLNHLVVRFSELRYVN